MGEVTSEKPEGEANPAMRGLKLAKVTDLASARWILWSLSTRTRTSAGSLRKSQVGLDGSALDDEYDRRMKDRKAECSCHAPPESNPSSVIRAICESKTPYGIPMETREELEPTLWQRAALAGRRWLPICSRARRQAGGDRGLCT